MNIYLLLTVNFNPSCVVFLICTMNECPLICASSSWLHVEQFWASLKQDQSMIVSVKVWESIVCLDRTPLEYVLPLLINPKEQLMIVSVDWYAVNWDRDLINNGTNSLCGWWLFWQNKIQVFCRTSFIIVAGNRIRGEEWCLTNSLYCTALNWDCGLVNCGTNILHGCWLCWQHEIQVYYWTSFISVSGNRIRGEGWCLIILFDCSVLNWDCGLVNCGANILHGCCLFWQKRDSGLLLEIF
jgi:hypothetical protein